MALKQTAKKILIFALSIYALIFAAPVLAEFHFNPASPAAKYTPIYSGCWTGDPPPVNKFAIYKFGKIYDDAGYGCYNEIIGSAYFNEPAGSYVVVEVAAGTNFEPDIETMRERGGYIGEAPFVFVEDLTPDRFVGDLIQYGFLILCCGYFFRVIVLIKPQKVFKKK